MPEIKSISRYSIFEVSLLAGGLALVAAALGSFTLVLKGFISGALFLIEFYFLLRFYRLYRTRIFALLFGGAFAALLLLQGRYFWLFFQNTGANQKSLNLLFVTFFQFILLILTAIPVTARGVRSPLLSLERGLKGFGGKIYTLSLFLWTAITLIYSPLTVFTSSWQEVEVRALPLTAWLFCYLVLLNAVGHLVFRLVSRELKILLIWMTLFAALSFWFYTYLLPGDFGHLDNFILSQSDSLYSPSSLKRYLEVVCLLMGFVLVIILVQRIPKPILALLGILNLMSLGQTISHALTSEAFDSKVELISDGTEAPAYAGGLLSFSRERNVLVIMLDGFCGGFMPEILEANPDLLREYQGFTWYPNALTSTTNTYGSIPPMVGGPRFTVEETGTLVGETLDDRYREAFRFFPDFFRSQGYNVAFTDPSYQDRDLTGLTERQDITLGYSKDFIAYWEKHLDAELQGDTIIPASEYSRIFSVIGLFKGCPFLLKPKIYYKGSWLKTNHGNVKVRHAVKELALLDVAPELSNADSPQKTFKFITSEMTHIPWPFDGEGRISKEFIRSTPQMIRDSNTGKMFDNPLLPYNAAVKALRVLAEWFDWMKSEGIYDNTRILIVSDHGYSGISPMFEDFRVIRDSEGRILEGTGRVQPIFLIKDFQQRGPLVRSDHFVSNADTAAFATKGIADTDPLKDPLTIDSDSRELIMSFVATRPEEQYEHGYRIHGQFLVKGSIFERENWKDLYELGPQE